jgi:GT2 family glycosyltransferase
VIGERAAGGGDAAARAPHWPAKLVVVDAERCPDEISAARADGGRYRALLLLVRAGGVPVGLVTVPCERDAVARAEIEPYVREVAAGRSGVQAPAPLPSPPPSVSVVISTVFERTDELRRCLESLRAVEYPLPFEILVVDNRLDEGRSGAWVERVPAVRLLVERQPGVSAGRNRGLAAACGELVAFIDDDVVVDPGWLAAYARRFAAHPDEVAVAGLVLPNGIETEEDARIEEYYGGYGARRFAPASHALDAPRRRGRLLRPATIVARDDRGAVVARFSLYEAGKLGVGANIAFRTATLRALGGFDTDLGPATPTRSGEDVAILARAAWRGHAIGFEPAAFVLHTDRQGDGALKAKLEAYGTGFTAIITALAVEDPRHLGALAATLPEGLRRLAVYFATRLPARGGPAAVSSVSALARTELRGMIRGPLAYARSRRRRRRGRSR